MFDLIFTGDTIDQGRQKINDLLFSGLTATGYWSPLNSASTIGYSGFSLEFSALTPSYPTNNQDSSLGASNLIIGNSNTISGAGGYNFVDGSYNYLGDLNNCFVNGNLNLLSNLSNSFIQGLNINISSGNCMSVIGTNDAIICGDTSDNNYISLLGNSYLNIEGDISNPDPHINFSTIIGNNYLSSQGNFDFVTILNGSNNSISNSLKNVVILGSNNTINTPGFVCEDVYILGNTLQPILSATTNHPLSGTYINDLCIEKGMILNTRQQSVTEIPFPFYNANPTVNFNEYNVSYLHSLSSSSFNSSFNSTVTATNPDNPALISLFLNVWINSNYIVPAIQGSGSNFLDYNSSSGGRWDNKNNYLSANTVFMTYISSYYTGGGFATTNKYIKFKG